MSRGPADVPQAFKEILRTIKGARIRADVVLKETPAPSRIAPYAVALNGEILVDGVAAASGRFVVLHDPDGQEAWGGTTRVVTLAKAEVEPEVGTDDLWAHVAWSWIGDALSGVRHVGLGGTVTRTLNESFGNIADHGRSVVVEMRVSWTPLDQDMAPHLEAWADLLGSCAGVPPLPEGVTMLPGKTA